jgi:hypothetical protein
VKSELLVANTVRFEQRASKRYKPPVLEPDRREGDDLHPGYGLDGILVNILGRNEKVYCATPLN